MAGQFAAAPRSRCAAAKAAIDGGLEFDLDNGLKLEIALFAGLFATDDRTAGCSPSSRTGPARPTSWATDGRRDPSRRARTGASRAGRGGLERPEAGQRPLPRLGGRHLRREVVDQLRPALHRLRPRPVRPRRRRPAAGPTASPRTGLRHRLLPAQPEAGRRAGRGPRHRPEPRHGRGGARNAAGLGLDVEGRVADAESTPLPRRQLRPGRRARRAAPHPRRRAGLREMLRVLHPAAGSSSPASRPGTATSSPAGSRG